MSQSPAETCPCPKCGRLLQQSGELIVGDVMLPTFQCDECLMSVDFAGEVIEIALTFVRQADGTLIDPADPDNKLRF